jgi:hypothetical protein
MPPLSSKPSEPVIWNPTVIAVWSLVFTPIFGSWLCSKNWLFLGDEALSIAASRWLKVGLIYYPLVFFLQPWYHQYTSSVLVEMTLLIGLYFPWLALSMYPQIKYAQKNKSSLNLTRSWRMPLTFALGLIGGIAGVILSLGMVLLFLGHQ